MTDNSVRNKMNKIVLLNIIGSASYQAINFLLTPILTRALGTYDFGLVTLYTSWVTILLPILSLSLESAISLVIIQVPKTEQNRYVTSFAGLMLINYAAVFSLVGIFIKPISSLLGFEPIVVVLLMLQCFGNMFINFIIVYFVQTQKTVFQFAFSISISIASFLLTLSLLKFISDPSQKYLCRIIGYAVPYVIGGIVVLAVLLLKKSKWFSVEVWKYALPICIPFVFHTLSHLILSQSGKIILQHFTENGVDNAGYYGFAYTIASIMHVVWTALNNAWVPYYYKLLKAEDKKGVEVSSKRYNMLFTGGFAAFALISPEVTKIMGGDKYAGAEKIVLVLLLGMYFIYMYSHAVNYKTYNKRTVSIAVGTIISAVTNVVLAYFLVGKYSYYGCAVAMAIAYGVLFLVHHITAKDKSKNYGYGLSFFGVGLLIAAASLGLSALLMSVFVVRWVIAAAIGGCLLLKIIKRKSIF